MFRKGIPYTMDVIDEHGQTASVEDIHRTLAAIEADADQATAHSFASRRMDQGKRTFDERFIQHEQLETNRRSSF